MRLSLLLLQLVSTIQVQANTEKTIFVAPNPTSLPNVHPGLDDLCLDVLSLNQSSLHVQLPVAFPTKAAPRGTQSWYLLDRLQPGQRYELRVCWVATQPTEFWLDTFTLTQTFETPNLIQSLAQYAEERDPASCQPRLPIDPSTNSEQTSVLFLRVSSAADFYAKNQDLMRNPPLVGVDIILDPYLFNILPRSLLPTIAFIVLVASSSWVLSGAIWSRLSNLTGKNSLKRHAD
ncbi:hypothetical protein EG327_004704 [Venturia inaequalis]|uniref:Uncharacterized protein n=1 Tax=Venturia inaequalis TaxID=5025 RepID=A0A8H3VB99_VENIN|nr:hypothetical protein EG327_004704 [Venturia inaequalis]